MGTRGFVPNRVDQLVGAAPPDDLGTCQVPGLEEYGEGSYDVIYCRIGRNVCAKPRFSLRSPLELASTRMSKDAIRNMNVSMGCYERYICWAEARRPFWLIEAKIWVSEDSRMGRGGGVW